MSVHPGLHRGAADAPEKRRPWPVTSGNQGLSSCRVGGAWKLGKLALYQLSYHRVSRDQSRGEPLPWQREPER
jgi:hypothetical protein